VFPHGKNAHEFELMVGLGMKPMVAIVAGTRGAAELLGLDGELGTVEAGKIADLVAVDGNPLDDVKTLAAPAFVMHEGKVVIGPPKLLR
jgi:imidazolonepropionase-like amidohydrolase